MENETKGTNYLVPGAIIIAGILIAGAVVYSNGGPKGKIALPSQSGVATTIDIVGDGVALGKSDAPVTVVEFADYQCPFCARFHKQVVPRILTDYVSTGKVKFVYRDFAFLDSLTGVDDGESHLAAEAARCADDQGKFWQYHNYLYEHQNGENQGAFTKANLEGFAKVLGLNTDVFSSCLASRKYQAAVEKSTADGRTLRVSGTPGTFVNGKLIEGALPYEEFKSAIDQALAGQ